MGKMIRNLSYMSITGFGTLLYAWSLLFFAGLTTYFSRLAMEPLAALLTDIVFALTGQVELSPIGVLIAIIITVFAIISYALSSRILYLKYKAEEPASDDVVEKGMTLDAKMAELQYISDRLKDIKSRETRNLFIGLGVGIAMGIIIPLILNIILGFKYFYFLGSQISFLHISFTSLGFVWVIIYIFDFKGKQAVVFTTVIGFLLGLAIISLF